jgi:triphosphoribosyl-dephospho-CoA synthase
MRSGVARVLADLDVADARLAYEAIRLALPGGLGEVPEQDVAAEPTGTLREVMELAAERDLVARQYANGFQEVFDDGVPALVRALKQTQSLETAIIGTQLQLMVRYPDTLIARKRGPADAAKALLFAVQILGSGWPDEKSTWQQLADFDRWLREEGHSRNPGTTADLVTASLFVALRTNLIPIARTNFFPSPQYSRERMRG